MTSAETANDNNIYIVLPNAETYLTSVIHSTLDLYAQYDEHVS